MFCIPFTGGMTYYSSSSARILLLNAIKAGCDNDVYVDEEIIEKVYFIGNRIETSSAATGPGTRIDPENPPLISLSSGLSIFLIIACTLILVTLVQMFYKKKKGNRGEDSDESEEEEHDSSESNDSFESGKTQ